MVAAVVASFCFSVGTASSQEDATTTTIVAAPETTTTTEAPQDTTTTEAPAETTTTVATAPTTTIDLSTVNLPGKAVTSGRLGLDIQFKDHPETNCNANLDLTGGSLNVVNDDDGNVGASYGVVNTNSTTGKAGVLMIKLGALPAAIAVVTVTGPCNVDTVGLGNYDAGTDYAKFDGVGIGVQSSDISDGLFAEVMRINETIGGTGDAANLDLHQVESLIMRPRS
jgi:hypothetical protein